MASDYTPPKGWYEFKDFNIRKFLEELEQEHNYNKFDSRDQAIWFLFSALNALREGMLEIESRLDKLEKKQP